MTYPTLATETIVERKGDDALERGANAVLTHVKEKVEEAAADARERVGDEHKPEPAPNEPSDETDEKLSG